MQAYICIVDIPNRVHTHGRFVLVKTNIPEGGLGLHRCRASFRGKATPSGSVSSLGNVQPYTCRHHSECCVADMSVECETNHAVWLGLLGQYSNKGAEAGWGGLGGGAGGQDIGSAVGGIAKIREKLTG